MKKRLRQCIIEVAEKIQEEIDNGLDIFFEERPQLMGDKPRSNLKEARIEHEARMKALEERLEELMHKFDECVKINKDCGQNGNARVH